MKAAVSSRFHRSYTCRGGREMWILCRRVNRATKANAKQMQRMIKIETIDQGETADAPGYDEQGTRKILRR